MIKSSRSTVLLVTILWQILQRKASCYPQLDIPFNNSKNTQISENRFQTNGHSDETVKQIVSRESNEIGIDDTLSFDRDRSQRYGPPYSNENDRRFYNENSSRYYQQSSDRDDDDKFYVQPRPSPDMYYISEKQRNRNGQRDFYSTVRNKCSFR